jgi:hypothetical protein
MHVDYSELYESPYRCLSAGLSMGPTAVVVGHEGSELSCPLAGMAVRDGRLVGPDEAFRLPIGPRRVEADNQVRGPGSRTAAAKTLEQ